MTMIRSGWGLLTSVVSASALITGLAVAGPAQAQAGPASSAEAVAGSVAPDHHRRCSTGTLDVALDLSTPLTPGGPTLRLPGALAPNRILTKVCLPEGRTPKAVQLLVHGIGYDHRYWNIADPADRDSDRYSWEAAAAKAGYATVAIDRIGNGTSSHPPSAAVTIDANASVVHQVVQALRNGSVRGPDGNVRFSRVALVGHSYGSITSFIEADRYRDVDALILTGVSHHLRQLEAPLTIEGLHYPAALDPQFAGTPLDPGYITTLPGTDVREKVFYAPGTDFDRRILRADDATKGGASQGELLNFPLFLGKRLDLRVPVFLLNGSNDGLFCSQTPLDLGAPCSSPRALADSERPFLGPNVPSVDAHIADGAGHVLNAFHSSRESFDAAMTWIRDTLSP
jgi:pimeloyl-ACP methyl ester carboxylesterase